MDFEAVGFATEKCLEDFGLDTKGDILALKAFKVRRQGNQRQDAFSVKAISHQVLYMRKEKDM